MTEEERLDAQLANLLEARRHKVIGLTPARMALGTASWKERWAWRLPHLLGWLNREASTERLTGIHPFDERMRRLDEMQQSLPDSPH